MSTGMKIAGAAAVAGLAGYGISEFVNHEQDQNEEIDELQRQNEELQRQQQQQQRMSPSPFFCLLWGIMCMINNNKFLFVDWIYYCYY